MFRANNTNQKLTDEVLKEENNKDEVKKQEAESKPEPQDPHSDSVERGSTASDENHGTLLCGDISEVVEYENRMREGRGDEYSDWIECYGEPEHSEYY